MKFGPLLRLGKQGGVWACSGRAPWHFLCVYHQPRAKGLAAVGVMEGEEVGLLDGVEVGLPDGVDDGVAEGDADGEAVGVPLGVSVGLAEGVNGRPFLHSSGCQIGHAGASMPITSFEYHKPEP